MRRRKELFGAKEHEEEILRKEEKSATCGKL